MIIHGHQRGSIQNLLEKSKNLSLGIRWGGPQVQGAINGEVHLLNSLSQLEAFRTNGIPCPLYTTSLAQARTWANEGKIVFGRDLEHTQGKDIVLPGDRRWAQKSLWTVYTPAVNEWRFHILKGACIARGVKEFVPDAKHPQPEERVVIRSRRLGWRLNHAVEPPEGLRGIAKKAVEAVKYDLGAVDILYTGPSMRGGPIGCVLEVNSRPAIRDDYTVNQYYKYLRRIEGV